MVGYRGPGGASYSMTGTQWLTTGAQGAQSLNYRDPVVGYKGPGGPVTQLQEPSGRLQGHRGASYSITETQLVAPTTGSL